MKTPSSSALNLNDAQLQVNNPDHDIPLVEAIPVETTSRLADVSDAKVKAMIDDR